MDEADHSVELLADSGRKKQNHFAGTLLGRDPLRSEMPPSSKWALYFPFQTWDSFHTVDGRNSASL